MSRFFAIGFFIGIIIALIITILFPIILEKELAFKLFQLKYINHLYSGGLKISSIFAVGSLVPIYFGIFGGLIGLITFKIKESFSVPKSRL